MERGSEQALARLLTSSCLVFLKYQGRFRIREDMGWKTNSSHMGCQRAEARPLARLILRINPRFVYLLRFILEGYDNLFVLTTVDRSQGLVEVLAARGAEEDLCSLLEEMAEEIGIQCSEWGEEAP